MEAFYGYSPPRSYYSWDHNQEQPYPSSTYYEPQYADQDHYYNLYPYHDPYEYQHPPQDYTLPSKSIEEMFDAIMEKSEQHEHIFQKTQQSLERSIQIMQDSLSRISEHAAQIAYERNTEEISLEFESVE